MISFPSFAFFFRLVGLLMMWWDRPKVRRRSTPDFLTRALAPCFGGLLTGLKGQARGSLDRAISNGRPHFWPYRTLWLAQAPRLQVKSGRSDTHLKIDQIHIHLCIHNHHLITCASLLLHDLGLSF